MDSNSRKKSSISVWFHRNENDELTTDFRLYFVARKVAMASRIVNTTSSEAEITRFLAE